MANASRDQNHRPTLLGVSNADGVTPVPLQVNPATNRLLAEIVGGTTPLTTKGDILTHNGTNDVRLGVGADGEVLTADSASTEGVKWSSAGAGDMTTAVYDPANIAEQLVGLTANQTLTNKTLTTPTLTLKQGAAPTPTAEGDIQWDTDDDKIKVGDGAGTKTFSDDISNAATYAPAAEGVTNGNTHDHNGGDGGTIDHVNLANKGTNTHAQIDTHIASTSNPHSVTAAQAGALANVVEDTTPQLGGQLDVNGNAIGDGTLELLEFTETASAVNHIGIKNNTTTNAPEVEAKGDDTNIDLKLTPKGTGIVKGELKRFMVQLLDSATDQTTGTTIQGDFRISNRAITVKAVGAYVDTAGTTGTSTIDINEAGTTILSTKITIDSGEKSSETAATPPVISDSAIAADAIITIDVDAIHSGTAAKGLKVWVDYVYT